MRPPKTTPSEQEKGDSVPLFMKIFIRHGEKVAVAVVVGIAVWIALQGLKYSPLTWHPETLVELAETTENTIRNNEHTIADEALEIFDYAAYAEQIKENILIEPYRSATAWKPILHPEIPPRGGFEILAAEAFEGLAVRRVDSIAQDSIAKGKNYWQRPSLPDVPSQSLGDNQNSANPSPMLWVNLYGTIPVLQQWEIFNQSLDATFEAHQPEYAYYELEKAEITPSVILSKEPLHWQPIIVYPDVPPSPDNAFQIGSHFDIHRDRLIPMGHLLKNQTNTSAQGIRDLRDVLLFSDSAIEPSKTYAYRIRLYLVNPNFNVQESHVEEGVDTHGRYVRSDWSFFAKVYVPNQTTIRLLTVTPTDSADFPRQQVPLGIVRGTILLDYFDMAVGQLLPPIEKIRLSRGQLCNMPKEELNRYLSRIGTTGNVMSASYPDAGLRSDVCVLDFSGGKKLQKRASRESLGTPDLFTREKALLLLPDGTMQICATPL